MGCNTESDYVCEDVVTDNIGAIKWLTGVVIDNF